MEENSGDCQNSLTGIGSCCQRMSRRIAATNQSRTRNGWVSLACLAPQALERSLLHPLTKQGSLTPVSLRRRKSPNSPPSSRFRSVIHQAKHRSKAILKSVNAFMTVPMYAALLSIFIAMIPPLQHLMQKAKPLEQAIKSAGACSSGCAHCLPL